MSPPHSATTVLYEPSTALHHHRVDCHHHHHRVSVSFKSISDSQFYGLVPHDDISGQNEGLDVDDVCVPALRPHIQPFTLKGKVAKRDPGGETEGERERHTKEETDWLLEYEHSQQPQLQPEIICVSVCVWVRVHVCVCFHTLCVNNLHTLGYKP